MPAVKFDDLAKPSTEVLGDDYQTSGYQLKAKQKTSWDSAVVTTTVDLFPGKDAVRTPAKLSWKLPKPFGLAGLSLDKLELDKAGKFKLEAVADKALHGVADLKLEAKSDLVDLGKATGGFTYTGLADTQVKFETTPLDPSKFTLEATREIQNAIVGVKLGSAAVTAPDVGVRVTSGNGVVALIAKDQFKVFNAYGYFKATADLKLALSYQHGGKQSGNLTAGLAYGVKPGTSLKAKVQQDGAISATVKHEVSKGFTVLAGGSYGANGALSYGLQLSIE